MKEKINIAELLKDCPKGMELDCTMFDNVTFVRVDNNREQFPIEITVGGLRSKYLTKEGCFHDNTLIPEAKCVIFPKGKTTWEGFQRPFKDGDVVFTTLGNIAIISEHIKKELFYIHALLIGDKFYNDENTQVVVERLATEEEKTKFFQAIKANGYRWNEETKTLEKLIEPKFKVGDRIKPISSSRSGIIVEIDDKGYYVDYSKGSGIVYISFTIEKNYELVPNKFDISTLVPFESRVLVRNKDNETWSGQFYSHYDKYSDIPFICIGVIELSGYKQCIPYNEETKHLLGTTNDCDEFYKTWE